MEKSKGYVTMTYNQIVDPDTRRIFAAQGGTVTIDKYDPQQRDLWLRLNRLVEADIVEEIDNTITAVSYRLPSMKAAA
jgi:hypothetical protein